MKKKEKNEESKELMKTGESLTREEMVSMLQKMGSIEENEITSSYLSMEPGESIRCWFMEMTTIKSMEKGKEGEDVPAVRLLIEDGSYAINANAVIANTCQRLDKPTPLELICTGKAGPKGREYFTYKIIELS